MIDKDVFLVLIGAIAGFLSAAILSFLNAWLSTRAEKLKRIEQEADERVGLIFEFLAGKATDNGDGNQYPPKIAWLILDKYTGPKKFNLSKLNLVTKQYTPLSERRVILGKITTLGRESHNNFVLPSSEVMKVHSIIRFESGKYVFYDISGEAGAYINKERAKRAVLKDGDWIEIQGFIILYAEQESTIRAKVLLLENDEEFHAALKK